MDACDLFEAEELVGYLDIHSLSSMLPDVDNPTAFASALTKLRLGRELILQERLQLALAFISLIREPAPQKLATIHKMMSIQTRPAQPATKSAPPAINSAVKSP